MSKLILLGLPIGNPQDITQRGFKTLQDATYILAEDTRNFIKLMRHYEIATDNKRIDSFHDHSDNKLDSLIAQLKNYGEIVLVSDAGSPIISDPAYPLVRAAIDAGVEIESVPGVSSVVVALELSGLPPHPFHFYGFLAREDQKKRESFDQAQKLGGQHLFFESPHRMEKTLKLLAKHHPDCDVFLGRELTKKFQTSYRFKASEWSEAQINYKGEFVMALSFPRLEGGPDFLDQSLIAQALDYLDHGGGTKKLSKLLSELTGQKKSEVYQKLMEHKP